MPTALNVEGFRFFFFSNEGDEPMHIHIEKADATAKFWLVPVELEHNYGFNSKELSKLYALVTNNKELLKQKWNEHFSK
jgi:hypothetical protein